jgi:LPS export ABC transporter permease LptG/LPS export ABC transporter permease LptF
VLKTLDRYVIREILPPTILSLLIFTFLLDIPPVMEQLEQLISKGVPWSTAGRMLLTLIPQSLGLTIPMSLLVGILIGLGRMSGDREAMALLACGVSPYRLLRPILLLSTVAAGAHLWVMLSAIPDANQTFRQIAYDTVAQQVENDVRPQVFFTNFPPHVLYTRDIVPGGGGWKDVLVADTTKPDAIKLYMARRGRLILDRQKQTVDLVLEDGTQYSNRGADGKQLETFRFPKQLIVTIDPKTVFSRFEVMRGLAELTVPQLQEQAAFMSGSRRPAHQEMEYIQQKFSFPAACLVFAIIGVALGLTVARDGKLAGFVVGIAVIFVYYILLYLAIGLTKGYYSGPGGGLQPLTLATISRWVPNLVLLPFGILALIWRARWAEGRLPFRSLIKLTEAATAWLDRRRNADPADGVRPARTGAGGRGRVVVVIRLPQLSWLMPNILDRYISAIYLRTVGLSFAALLGIFYISTFIDKSDKLFKGEATTPAVVQLLGYMTPQFVYYVIPLAALLSVLVTFGLLSRSSELSVMKACGISLYRVAAPLMILSLVWSAILFGLEQRLLARANEQVERLDAEIRGRPPRTSNPLLRTWLIGGDGSIYHYDAYDPQRNVITNLAIYRPAKTGWELESQIFTPRATYRGDQWVGTNGWQQDFAVRGRWTPFTTRTLAIEPPDYFETQQPIAEMMTVPELKRFIDEQAASGMNVIPLTVELQKKLAFPLVTVVMTLLAIPFGMTTGKRGTLYGIGIGIVLALSYWIIGSAFAAIGKAGMLDPILAGWAPNILAAGSAAYLLLTART